MKKLVFLLFLIPSTLLANEITDYKCQKLQKDGNNIIAETQRCENKEVVCYEASNRITGQVSIWCYKK